MSEPKSTELIRAPQDNSVTSCIVFPGDRRDDEAVAFPEWFREQFGRSPDDTDEDRKWLSCFRAGKQCGAAEPTVGLVRTTADGAAVRSVLSRVRLASDRKEVYPMSMKNTVTGQWEKKQVITAAGYDRLNQFAGIEFITPETLLGPDGSPVGNPYAHYEEGELIWIKIRRIGCGYNASGNRMRSELTVTYDIRLYFAQDAMAKYQGGGGGETQGWGELVTAESVTAKDKKADKHKKYVRLPGGMYLVMDMKRPEVLKLLTEHINRQRFAERIATRICTRNILKQLLAASVLRDNSNVVPVVGWHALEADDRSSPVIHHKEEMTASAEEIEGEFATAGDDDMQPSEPAAPAASGIEPIGQDAVSEDSQDDEELAQYRSHLRSMAQHADLEKLNSALEQAGFGDLTKVLGSGSADDLAGAIAVADQLMGNGD